MSYNIDHVEYIGPGRLTINRELLGTLIEKHKDELPELNFLDEISCNGTETDVTIHKIWWSGEGSGGTYDLFKELLKQTKGEAQILFIWENGDSKTALEIKNGIVKEKKIKISLED